MKHAHDLLSLLISYLDKELPNEAINKLRGASDAIMPPDVRDLLITLMRQGENRIARGIINRIAEMKAGSGSIQEALIKGLENLIIENETNLVIVILRSLCEAKGAHHIKQQVIVNGAQFHKLESDVNSGIKFKNEETVERNKINQSLLKIVHTLYPNTLVTSEEINPSGTPYYSPEYREATAEEIIHLKEYFKKYNKVTAKELLELSESLKINVKHKVWRPRNDEQFPFRFWGLLNTRFFERKWLWLCWDFELNRFAAIKEVQPSLKGDNPTFKRFQSEVEFYQKHQEVLEKHPNLIAMLDTGDDKDWFAMEFAGCGDLEWYFFSANLADKMRSEINKVIYQDLQLHVEDMQSWEAIKSIFLGVADAVALVHELGYVHRNIDPDGILIAAKNDQTGTLLAKICDFERTVAINRPLPDYQMLPANKLSDFDAPERYQVIQQSENRIEDQSPTKASDVYSLATILVRLLSGDHNNKIRTNEGLKKSVKVINNRYPLKFGRFLDRSLDEDPFNRPDMVEFKRELAKVNWLPFYRRRHFLAMIGVGLLFVLSVLGIYIADTLPYQLIVEGELDTPEELIWSDKVLVKGPVYLAEGATLQIKPGTHIFFRNDWDNPNGMLIIPRNTKIIADGEDDPIIFDLGSSTLQQWFNPQYSWAGIIICGNAPINDWQFGELVERPFDEIEFLPNAIKRQTNRNLALYGGDKPKDSSGVLRNIMINRAGGLYSELPNIRSNSLTLAGVGNSTVLERILVTHAEDDGFQIFGGNISAKNWAVYSPKDDAFDFENGATINAENLFFFGPLSKLENPDPVVAAIEGFGFYHYNSCVSLPKERRPLLSLKNVFLLPEIDNTLRQLPIGSQRHIAFDPKDISFPWGDTTNQQILQNFQIHRHLLPNDWLNTDTTHSVVIRDSNQQPFLEKQLFFAPSKKVGKSLVDDIWQALEQLKK